MSLSEEKLFYTITEVSQHLGVSASTLRFWEKEIPKLKPRTNNKGNRQYTTEDIERLGKVKFLVKDQGHTLAGAKAKLNNKLNEVEKDAEMLARLESVKSFLEELKKSIQ